MVHRQKALISVVAAIAFAGFGYASWTQGPQGSAPDHHGRDDNPMATISAPAVPALQARSTPEASPASQNPVAVYRNGLLAIQAHGVSLRGVLAAINEAAGVTFSSSAEVDENVWIDLGPRPVRDAVSELLDRTSYGYAFVNSSGGAGGTVALQVFLTKKENVSDLAGRAQVRQLAPGFPVPGAIDHSPPPDEKAMAQQRAVDAIFDACKAPCDAS